jgi:hypothetical protein
VAPAACAACSECLACWVPFYFTRVTPPPIHKNWPLSGNTSAIVFVSPPLCFSARPIHLRSFLLPIRPHPATQLASCGNQAPTPTLAAAPNSEQATCAPCIPSFTPCRVRLELCHDLSNKRPPPPASATRLRRLPEPTRLHGVDSPAKSQIGVDAPSRSGNARRCHPFSSFAVT